MALRRLSPLITLFIGYILGYVFYPVVQLWTCTGCHQKDADITAHAQSLISRRVEKAMSKKDISILDGARDDSALNSKHDSQNSAGYNLWRRFISRSKTPRPAYLRSEYTVRGRVFVGVITAGQYLGTRAKAVHETWAGEGGVPGIRVVFYVGSDCNISHPDLETMEIICLPNIHDNIYPPQRKVFAALQHMYRYHGNNYQWFVRADDDVYIRLSRLDRLLGRLDANENVYLGRPGTGKKKDVQRLQLRYHERYCMGGPGVVLSRAALRDVVPHLHGCLETVEVHNQRVRRGTEGGEGAWFNKDVELGRCISRALGIQCSNSKEVMNYFVQDYNSDALRPSTLWGSPAFRQLITLHPIKRAEHMYSVHLFYTALSLQTIQKYSITAENTISELCRKLPLTLLPQDYYKLKQC